MRDFALIVSCTREKRVIGKNNSLIWRIPSDLKQFREKTIGDGNNAVIMGRKTWESLPLKPLPKRQNIVLTSAPIENTLTAISLNDALQLCNHCNQVFVIGGEKVYEEAIKSAHCKTIFLTEILNEGIDGDVFFPFIDETIYKTTFNSDEMEENGWRFRFKTFEKIN
jgi:dihydrofolate reductase